MQDARGVKRADRERRLASRDDLQRCTVCGRWFIRRKDAVCSVACMEKAAAADDATPPAA